MTATLRMGWLNMITHTEDLDHKLAFCELACGKRKPSPFPDDLTTKAREYGRNILRMHGAEDSAMAPPPLGQPLWLGPFTEHTRLSGDPDHRVLALGVA